MIDWLYVTCYSAKQDNWKHPCVCLASTLSFLFLFSLIMIAFSSHLSLLSFCGANALRRFFKAIFTPPLKEQSPRIRSYMLPFIVQNSRTEGLSHETFMIALLTYVFLNTIFTMHGFKATDTAKYCTEVILVGFSWYQISRVLFYEYHFYFIHCFYYIRHHITYSSYA